MARKKKNARTWKTLGAVRNVGRHENNVVVDCGDEALWIDFPHPGIARVRLAVESKLLPGASGRRLRSRAALKGAVEERRGRITVRATGIEVEIRTDPVGLVFSDKEGRTFLDDMEGGGHAFNLPRIRLTKPRISGERAYGLGEKAWGLERSHRAWRMWNTDCHPYHQGSDPLYKSVPLLLMSRPPTGFGRQGRIYYGVFLDNAHATRFDLKRREDWTVEAEGGPLEYHIIAGPTPAEVLERYTALTGRMPLPPLWALGYHQSRWSYYPDRRVRRLADDFRDQEIPCDAIHLDIDHMDGFRVFTWNKKRFPQPARLVRDLKKQGFHLVPIVNPGIKAEKNPVTRVGLKKGHFLKDPGGKPLQARVWPGKAYFPDFTSPHVRRWWGDLHADMVEMGITGFWIDMNEPSVFSDPGTLAGDVPHHGAPGRRDHAGNHNLYASLMAEATYRGLRRLDPDARPFILTRAGFAGVQRHAATWTGDNASTWKDLKLSLPMLLGLGISGIPFCGADVGGFSGTPTAELFTRWVQAAALTPLFRAHTIRHSPDQEPWSFGAAAEERVKKAICLRYRLMPYLYTVFEAASRTGAPVMRPLWWTFPDDPRAQTTDEQFMVGDSLLVAPVLNRGAASRTVYFPEGTWRGLDGRSAIQGPITRSIKAPMDRLPVFLRGGTILPARRPEMHAGEAPLDPLEITVFLSPDLEARGMLYEDEGESFDYQRGRFLRTVFTASGEADHLAVRAETEGKMKIRPRTVVLTLIGPDGRKASEEVQVEDRGAGWQAEIPLE